MPAVRRLTAAYGGQLRMAQRLRDSDLGAPPCRSLKLILGRPVGVAQPQLLVFLRSWHTVVIGVTYPRPAHTM